MAEFSSGILIPSLVLINISCLGGRVLCGHVSLPVPDLLRRPKYMAPRTRSSRTHTKRELLAHAEALKNGPVNQTGFPGLPVECLLEIASWYPVAAIPMVAPGPPPRHRRYLERGKALKALSQTCNSFRQVFLTLLWRRLEVCSHSGAGIGVGHAKPTKNDAWPREMARELVDRMETLMVRAPYLAGRV